MVLYKLCSLRHLLVTFDLRFDVLQKCMYVCVVVNVWWNVEHCFGCVTCVDMRLFICKIHCIYSVCMVHALIVNVTYKIVGSIILVFNNSNLFNWLAAVLSMSRARC